MCSHIPGTLPIEYTESANHKAVMLASCFVLESFIHAKEKVREAHYCQCFYGILTESFFKLAYYDSIQVSTNVAKEEPNFQSQKRLWQFKNLLNKLLKDLMICTGRVSDCQ